MDSVSPAQTPNVTEDKGHQASPLQKYLLLLLVVLLIVISGGIYLLFNISKNNSTNTQSTQSSTLSPTPQPTIPITTTYDNPFDSKSQNVNPFSQSENPFDALAQ